MARTKRKSNLTKKVKRIVNSMSETKTSLQTFDSTVSDTGFLIHLTSIAQGDGQSNRDGNQVYLKGMRIRLHAVLADTYNFLRVLLVRARTSFDDVSATDFPAGAGTDPFLEEMDYDKYVVVKDFPLLLDAGKHHQMRNFYVKVNKKIQWDGSGADNVSVNPYFLYFVTDSDVASHPPVTMTVRKFWKDM